MTAKTQTRHACARCGKRSPAERMVYSRHTGARYCRDLDACTSRARRRRKTSDAPRTITDPTT